MFRVSNQGFFGSRISIPAIFQAYRSFFPKKSAHFERFSIYEKKLCITLVIIGRFWCLGCPIRGFLGRGFQFRAYFKPTVAFTLKKWPIQNNFQFIKKIVHKIGKYWQISMFRVSNQGFFGPRISIPGIFQAYRSFSPKKSAHFKHFSSYEEKLVKLPDGEKIAF